MAEKLFFVRTCDTATPPKRSSPGAAGYDLCAAFYVEVPARDRALIPTGIKVAIPSGYYGRIAPRSGLAVTQGLDVGAGVIDPDYRGEIYVLMFNHSDRPYLVSPGHRVAQLILERIGLPETEEVTSLDETERGEGAFGSTGV